MDLPNYLLACSSLSALFAFWLTVRREDARDRDCLRAYLDGLREGRQRQADAMAPGVRRVRALHDRLNSAVPAAASFSAASPASASRAGNRPATGAARPGAPAHHSV